MRRTNRARPPLFLGVATGLIALAGALWFAVPNLLSAGSPGPVRLEATPAVSAMRIFSRPGSELLPSAITQAAEGLLANAPPNAPDMPGKILLAQGRSLLSDVGTRHRAIYGFPTEDGEVCEIFTGVMQGCVKAFPVNQPITIDGTGASPPESAPPAELGGLAKDKVASVKIELGGDDRAAVIGANAWYYEFPDNHTSLGDVSAIVVTLTGGSTVKVPYTAYIPATQ